MSDYLCVWSTQAFSTRAGPGAILISQSRVSITFAFPCQSSKTQGFPADMCSHFSGLPVCCLAYPMLIWILGFLPEMVLGNFIYRISLWELVDGSSSISPFVILPFWGPALAPHLPTFSENCCFPAGISQLWWQGSSVTPSTHKLSKSLLLITMQPRSYVETAWSLTKTILCWDLLITALIPCDRRKVIYWFPFSFRQVFISMVCL